MAVILLSLPDIAYEDQLRRRANRGDVDALRAVYEGYYTPVYQFIRLRVDDTATAEDLASTVFEAYVRACRTGKGPRKSLRGWLFRVARHTLHDHFGTNRRLRQTTLDEALPDEQRPAVDEQVMRTMQGERLRAAVRQLTVEQQEVIALRFGQMLTLEQTADVMGKRPGAIKQLQRRAVNRLRALLAGPNPEEHDAP